MDEIPAAVLRRRELFAELKRDIDRLSPYPAVVSIDMDEQQMREALDQVERLLEYAEVAKQATLENARVEDDDRTL